MRSLEEQWKGRLTFSVGSFDNRKVDCTETLRTRRAAAGGRPPSGGGQRPGRCRRGCQGTGTAPDAVPHQLVLRANRDAGEVGRRTSNWMSAGKENSKSTRHRKSDPEE